MTDPENTARRQLALAFRGGAAFGLPRGGQASRDGPGAKG